MGLFAYLLTSPAFAQADKPVPVVATFSILGDMVKRIGGDHVSVITLVGRNGDTHVYQPTPADARAVKAAKVLFAPGKASNAGGVATSGLEMSQNSLRMNWTREEVDERLLNIMKDIHTQCVTYGTDASGYVDYVKGANIAGFVKVADAMIDQGVV